MLRNIVTLVLVLVFVGIGQNTVFANFIVDASFEQQAVTQGTPGVLQSNGEIWGYSDGTPTSISSWQYNVSGSWTGGAIARTEDFAAGWKRARTGVVFGIIKDRQTMSQSFTATTSGPGLLTWYDANRAAWKSSEWFGRPNDYSVTLTDSAGNVQTLGNYTSEVAGGNSYSTPAGNGWWTMAGKTGWYSRSASGFNLQAGMTYTLSFNSLSPYYLDSNGNQQVDDRTTFLDDISLTAVPEPSSLGILSLGALGCAFLRRRRQQG